MTGDLSRVAPGDRLNIKASVYNELLELLRDPRIRGLLGSGAVDMGRETETRVLVRNDSGQDVDEGQILRPTAPLILPADNERAYKERRLYSATTPLANKPFVVTAEPIAAGSIGPAVIFGETWCNVLIASATHDFASPNGLTANLTSGASGSARIVWREADFGIQRCRVLLQWLDTACCGGGGTIDPGPQIKCYSCLNAPPCLAVLVNDGFGWQGTVYASLISTGDRACAYSGQAVTPNAVLRYNLGIGGPTPGFNEPGGSNTFISSQALMGIQGGTRTCSMPCAVWNGTGSFPVGTNCTGLSQGANPPVILSAQPASDPSLCTPDGGLGGGIIGGGGGGGGGVFCNPCDPATDFPCYNCQNGQFCSNWEACFSGGMGLQQKAAGGCSGDCGCGGTCGGTASPALDVPGLIRFWSTIDYVNAQASSKITPLFQNYADVGNVGAGEDTLFSNTVPANTLAINGDSLEIEVTFIIAAGQTARPRVKFGGISIYDPGGPITASLVDTIIPVRILLTRATSSTARATATSSLSLTSQYTPEGTLTGLNFAAAITVLMTGEGVNDNDIKAVQSLGVKNPSSTTLTTLGVTTVQVLSFGTDDIVSIPQDAAGYAGTSASQLSVGVSSGAVDVDIYAAPTATVTKGQVVRLFKDVSGTKSPAGTFEIKARTASADNPDWQAPQYLTTLRVNGTTEKIYVSKENNEGLIARGVRKNYF